MSLPKPGKIEVVVGTASEGPEKICMHNKKEAFNRRRDERDFAMEARSRKGKGDYI